MENKTYFKLATSVFYILQVNILYIKSLAKVTAKEVEKCSPGHSQEKEVMFWLVHKVTGSSNFFSCFCCFLITKYTFSSPCQVWTHFHILRDDKLKVNWVCVECLHPPQSLRCLEEAWFCSFIKVAFPYSLVTSSQSNKLFVLTLHNPNS